MWIQNVKFRNTWGPTFFQGGEDPSGGWRVFAEQTLQIADFARGRRERYDRRIPLHFVQGIR